MPMVRVCTNLADSQVPQGFELCLTELLAQQMGKPASRIAVEIATGARLVHGASNDPCVVMSIRSIGALSPAKNAVYTEKISQLIRNELSIPNDKIVIDFTDLDPTNVGFNGTTVAEALAQKDANNVTMFSN